MKKLTKEQVYVLIDNQPDCDRAIEILTKAGEPMWKEKCAFKFDKVDKYLYVCTDGDWLIADNISNRTQVTLDELERILMPKIKKAELMEKITGVNESVEALKNMLLRKGVLTEQDFDGHFAIQQYGTDNTYPTREIVIDTIESEKPAFEVGKVYKGKDEFLLNVMIYVTKIEDEIMFGFGFDGGGNWIENDNWGMTDQFTEATHEEWFNRLDEEYNRRGFKKGVTFNNSKLYERSFEDAEMNIDFLQLRGLNTLSVNEYKDANEWYEIMKDGKWAEIIEEPQYQAGTLGAFWDGDFDECLEKGTVLFGELDHITENGHFRRKGASWSWYNFKPLINQN